MGSFISKQPMKVAVHSREDNPSHPSPLVRGDNPMENHTQYKLDLLRRRE